MFQISPVVARFFPRLAYQLVPAAVVTTVGVLLLSNLAKTPSVATDTATVEAPITTEAVFKATPREVQAEAKEPDTARTKTASHAPVKQAARKAVAEPAAPRQSASLPPLQIVPVPEQQPQATVAETDNTIMGRLRSASASVQRLPQWTANSVTGWFAAATPPRPPADVPTTPANFQAAM